MANALLSISFLAATAVANNRILKHGSGDRDVTVATGPTDFSIGVVNEMPAGVAAGERMDVVRVGIAWVEAGAAIPRGSQITSDSRGRAVTAAPAAGVNCRVIGVADEAATDAGDVIRFLIAPGSVKG